MFIVHNNLDHIPLNFYNKYEEYKNKKYEAPKKKKNTSSKYIGVCFSKNRNKWRCNVSINFKQNNLGYFNDEIEAARKRDLYILINQRDEHYKLNFEWNKEVIK